MTERKGSDREEGEMRERRGSAVFRTAITLLDSSSVSVSVSVYVTMSMCICQ